MALINEKELYEHLLNKNIKKVYHIAVCLLQDEQLAQESTIMIFKQVFSNLDIKEVKDSEFKVMILDKTIGYCKNIITKKKPKAYNIKNQQLNINNVPSLSKEQFKDYMLNQFTDLQRLIFVMNVVCNYSVNYMSKKLKTHLRNVKNLLDIQEYNVTQLLLDSKLEYSYKEIIDYIRHQPIQVPAHITETLNKYIEEKTKDGMKKRKFTIISIIIAVCLVLTGITYLLASNSNNDTEVTSEFDTSLTYTAVIDIKDYGTITVELDDESAPVTVENFVTLANEGFYDGLTFHRIIEDFMMQGGDPNGDGSGGSENTIKGEFTNNGDDNDLSHTRGAISMARSSEYDSASSQFFIVHQDSTYLDGDYAVFGYVTDGMEVVDEICTSVEVTDDNGTVESENQPVINTITITAE